MSTEIDFTKGGYQGDAIEKTFKPFSSVHMPFWWHFREVLRSSDRASLHWKKSDGTDLLDDEQRELVAISMTHYAVYTGIAEAQIFFDNMETALGGTNPPVQQLFDVRRTWKAMYSSLYSSFNALCNIVCMVVGKKSVFGKKSTGEAWNSTPKDALVLVKAIKELSIPLDRCKKRLEIRDHLDHYWLIWHVVGRNQFLIDKNFRKGYVALHPETEVVPSTDARQLAYDHVVGSAQDFNLVYRELAVRGGYLDQYLSGRGWMIDYTEYGFPHNGQRPRP